jgi:hypothetical protein
MIRCPVCGWHEFPKVGRPGASWTFNGNYEKPTFHPSMNEKVGPFPDGHSTRCHFVLTNGVLKFCDDCTHDMKGKSVPLEPWTPAEAARHGLEL